MIKMKIYIYLFTIILGILSIKGFSQEKDTLKENDEIFYVVEVIPEFPGGDSGRMEYIRQNLKYPKYEIEHNIQGLVVVSFVVEKDGSITNAKILKSVSEGIDKEALRMVNTMPKWSPGQQRGKAVRTTINLPLRFILDNGKKNKKNKNN